jgi:2-(1,2-epoxy-1,2-dihydrophenyl)acetyl-CoA isomerase
VGGTEAATPVRLERAGGVATVTLDRPDALNALTAAVKEALLDVLTEVALDRDVRAVVLTGQGRAFCVGQDLREHAGTLAAGAPSLDTVRRHYNPLVLALTRLPQPVVAAVNGVAAGAGAGLAFACDFRIAARSASFLMAFSRIGLSGDSGTTWTLPRLVGHARAVELLMLAEPVDAARAEQLGLVGSVVADEDLPAAAGALTERLAAGPTRAYAAIKRSLGYGAGHGLAETLEYEAQRQQECGATADHRAATEAFLAKQPARFTGR